MSDDLEFDPWFDSHQKIADLGWIHDEHCFIWYKDIREQITIRDNQGRMCLTETVTNTFTIDVPPDRMLAFDMMVTLRAWLGYL